MTDTGEAAASPPTESVEKSGPDAAVSNDGNVEQTGEADNAGTETLDKADDNTPQQLGVTLEKKLVKDLRDECKAAGITGYSKKKREELIDLLVRKKPRLQENGEETSRKNENEGEVTGEAKKAGDDRGNGTEAAGVSTVSESHAPKATSESHAPKATEHTAPSVAAQGVPTVSAPPLISGVTSGADGGTKPAAKKRAKCEHGKLKRQCRDCGGSGVCIHGRIKSQCKQCGGKAICQHGRIRRRCKECGGSAICIHGRDKYTCKQCGGSGVCTHGREKYSCKECGGSRICIHGRRKDWCKECGGYGLCTHGREKYSCKECGGSRICTHGKRKSRCRECGGSDLCAHGRRKSRCKDCGGSGICTHGRLKYSCQECMQTTSAAQSSSGASTM